MQMMISSTVIEYLQDIWNIIDVGSIVFFALGMLTRRTTVLTDAFGSSTDDHRRSALNDVIWWKFYYGVSLFFLMLRALRVLAIFRKLGLLVIITFEMFEDVFNFFVVFLVFALSFAVLLFDAGSSKPYLEQDSCGEGEAGYAPCIPVWWLLRTLLQGFGELFLDEMENELAFTFAVLAFIVLNVMLLNLLIAVRILRGFGRIFSVALNESHL